MVPVVNLRKAFEGISDYWSPKVVGRVNDQYVKVAKIKGDFVFHAHDDEDEMFQVVKGGFRMEFTDHAVELGEGDVIVVPKGVQHRPVADEECWVVLVETVSTKHTGDVVSEHTKTIEQQLA
jgi:mannose-6-phosphate isomerase-like protein (cupin superfamily)